MRQAWCALTFLERLARIAAANGAPDARIVVLPTTLMIALGRARRTTIELIPQRTGALRLDQISALYEVVKQAEHGEIAPGEGLNRMQAIRTMEPRHGHLVTVLGHTMMTVGLCLILQPALLDVAIAAAFGAFVGSFVLLTSKRHTLSVLTPVIAALIVSALTFEAVKHGIADPGLTTLIAPLVTFLPGGALTTATVELASGETVAGSSRLVYGGLQMLLLAFGIVAGAELVGLPERKDLHDNPVELLGWWAPWVGVVVFGVATAVYFSAPRGALRWLLLVLLVAWIGQLAGDQLVGADVSGFVGALAMTPSRSPSRACRAAHRHRSPFCPRSGCSSRAQSASSASPKSSATPPAPDSKTSSNRSPRSFRSRSACFAALRCIARSPPGPAGFDAGKADPANSCTGAVALSARSRQRRRPSRRRLQLPSLARTLTRPSCPLARTSRTHAGFSTGNTGVTAAAVSSPFRFRTRFAFRGSCCSGAGPRPRSP
jgi:uncharacterized membrane protein YjjP (DUF1212 family)